jgi:hypothetical protein
MTPDPTNTPKRALERLRVLVEHESPSGDAARAAALAQVIARELTAAGARTETVPAPDWGEHVRAGDTGERALQSLRDERVFDWLEDILRP